MYAAICVDSTLNLESCSPLTVHVGDLVSQPLPPSKHRNTQDNLEVANSLSLSPKFVYVDWVIKSILVDPRLDWNRVLALD